MSPVRVVRVLQLIQHLDFGGMERLVSELAKRADRRRFETHILVLQAPGHFARGLDEYATIHVERPWRTVSMIWPGGLIRRIRQIEPDVVHTHDGVWYKGSLAARRAGVPRLVHTVHGYTDGAGRTSRWLARLAARRTDLVIAVSAPLATELREVVPLRVPVEVVRNGVDTDRFQPRPDNRKLYEELGVPPSTPVVGSVGRLEPIKGYDSMLRAYAVLRQSWTKSPAPVLVLIGDGSERASLEAQTHLAGLSEGVRFLGWRDDIEDLLPSFSVFSLSSRREGTSVSLLEAMSAGVCPVVTDVGGNADVLGPDLQHRLVRSADPEALGAAWLAALESEPARTTDAVEARRRVVDSYSLQAMVNRYERVYMGGAGSPVPRIA